MRVLEVVYNWPAETFIQRHIMALQSVSFPIRVVARHAPSSFPDSASLAVADASIHAEIMPNFNHLGWMGKLASLRYLSGRSLRNRDIAKISEKTLLGFFERLRPDLIHFHDSLLASAMAWIPRVLGIPYTLSLRGSDVHNLTGQTETHMATVRSTIEESAGVHVVCQDLGRKAVNHLGCHSDYSVIYTTAPIPSVLPHWAGGAPPGHARLVASGRFVWMKGFANLLVALRQVRDQGLDARLTIIGSGPDLDHLLYLRKLLELEAFVDFSGKLSYEQISALYGRAHAYVQSSVAEGLSNSLVEAMAHGLPVFATDVGGTREVVEDGISGFLLAPLAPQDWSGKLVQVGNAALMEQVRTCAFEKATQLFSAERHARAFAGFFDKATRPRNAVG